MGQKETKEEKTMSEKWAKGLFWLLMIGLFIWSAILTIEFTSLIFPSGYVELFLSLLVFDVGAVAWKLVFQHQAKGTWQR